MRRGMFGVKGSGDTSGYGRLVRDVALPGSSPRPYGGYFDEVVDALTAALGDRRVRPPRRAGRGVPRRAHPAGAPRALVAVAQALRDDAGAAIRAVPRRVAACTTPTTPERELHAVYP